MPSPSPHLRIIIADTPACCQDYRKWLPSLGHEVIAEVHTGRELIEQCLALNPDLVLTEIDLPGFDGIVASVEINRHPGRQFPVVLVSSRQDAEILERVGVDHIMGFLAKPVKPVDLVAAVHLASIRFACFMETLRNAADLAQALADRKIIERAKGIVMKRGQTSEEEAFRRMQRMASEKHQKLVEVAKTILIAEETFQGKPEQSPGGKSGVDPP
jgi:response regulator NasT